MAIKDVETKCYILALFIRNDGARFLLGSGAYEFKEGQQHFAANTMQNDVVEVQGNDGYLLAGQVRRPGVQSFDGYVGDSSTSKPVVEGLRRDFFQFFRKGYFYKVVYVFPDGSAIQRKRGFLVDAPVVQELYQIYPEYHVALNFEDINYYFYDENDAGEEIYGKSAIVGLSMATGGLVWDNDGAVTDPLVFGGVVTVKGAETINNLLNVAVPLASVGLYGDTYQQTYSGKNILPNGITTQTFNGVEITRNDDGSLILNGRAETDQDSIEVGQIEVRKDVSYTISGVVGFSQSNTLQLFAVSSIAFPVGNRLQSYDGPKTAIAKGDETIIVKLYIYRGQTYDNVVVRPMVEVGSSASPFEPYVGGIPSPNPGYPQEVQTVTGKQTVTVAGKNLMQSYPGVNQGITTTVNADGGVHCAGTTNASWGFNIWVSTGQTGLPILPAGTYTLSISDAIPFNIRFVARNAGGDSVAGDINLPAGSTSVSFTSSEEIAVYYPWCVGVPNGTVVDFTTKFQLEAGSSATDYKRYQSQSYTISLGSIELCKIGDYQDYIYKSGDDWYVHKEIKKVIYDGSEEWTRSTNAGTNNFYVLDDEAALVDNFSIPPIFSNMFTRKILSDCWYSGNEFNAISMYNLSGQIRVFFPQSLANTVGAFKSWLNTHNVMAYFALATPTDTQITDTTLIGQLEALGAAKLYVGENNLTVTATGTNLPAELEVGYYTELEDGYGFVWEEGRSPSNIIAVDSIDDVFPVLTITGETENPILTNVTTGTIFQYNGTITASQTLVVDMMNQTATLNGTSVIGNVTGDWVYFAPGNNRVSYTATNADAPDATIEWQEIVG